MNRALGKPTRVLMLVQNLPVPFDRRVWMEATTLRRAGYRVTVICPTSDKHPRLRETLEGIEIRRFPLVFEGRGTIGLIWEYLWCLTLMTALTTWEAIRHRIAVVHICNPPDLLFLCALPAQWLRRSKLIFDQHDLGPELWEAKGHNPHGFLGRMISFAERQTYRAADVVISTNQSYRDIAIARGGKASDRVFIVRSAPRRDFAVQEPRDAREITDTARLVYLGTMGSQEGIDLLLGAVAEIRTQMSDLRLTLDLIGDGPERPILESLASELGISDSCVFHGRVDDEHLRSIVSDADLAVNPDRPSKMNDLSSMNKIVEYMALAVPVVQFRCTEGHRTALDAGLSVDVPSAHGLARAITTLLKDRDRRAAMKAAGLLRFNSVLCWEGQSGQLIASYYRVLGRNASCEASI